MVRTIIAGVVGGIALFMWGAASHMTVPEEMQGVRSLPHGESLTTALSDHLSEPGFYMFPPMAEGQTMEQYAEVYKQGPVGVVIYHPNKEGEAPMSPMQLGRQLATDVALGLVVAFLLALGRLDGFGRRVVFAGVLGLLPALTSDVPFWNWYKSPIQFSAFNIVENLIGMVLVGVVAGAILGRRGTDAKSDA